MVIDRSIRRWFAALLTLAAATAIVAVPSAASARTDLPIFGEEVVYTDTFNEPWGVDSVGGGEGCGNCTGGREGNPRATLGITTTGWAAVRKAISIRTATSFGVPYDYCKVSAAVNRTWTRPSTSPALVNIEVIDPPTWSYLSFAHADLRSDGEVRISSGTFAPTGREFVVGVALVADPNSVNVQSLNSVIDVDNIVVTCHYMYYP
jgi:hypothetical protein